MTKTLSISHALSRDLLCWMCQTLAPRETMEIRDGFVIEVVCRDQEACRHRNLTYAIGIGLVHAETEKGREYDASSAVPRTPQPRGRE